MMTIRSSLCGAVCQRCDSCPASRSLVRVRPKNCQGGRDKRGHLRPPPELARRREEDNLEEERHADRPRALRSGRGDAQRTGSVNTGGPQPQPDQHGCSRRSGGWGHGMRRDMPAPARLCHEPPRRHRREVKQPAREGRTRDNHVPSNALPLGAREQPVLLGNAVGQEPMGGGRGVHVDRGSAGSQLRGDRLELAQHRRSRIGTLLLAACLGEGVLLPQHLVEAVAHSLHHLRR